jgi:hypothetical protein
METLIQKAAKYGYYQAGNFPEDFQKVSFRQPSFPDQLTKLPSEAPGYETGIFYKLAIQDKDTAREYRYAEEPQLLVSAKGSGLICWIPSGSYSDKWDIYPITEQTIKFRNISRYREADATKHLKEPNKIGVFTDKKINDWLQHCEAKYNAKNELYKAIQAESNAHLETIKDFLSKVDAKVTERDDRNQVDFFVETSVFSIHFFLDKNQAHLRKTVTFKGNFVDIINIEKALKNEKAI